MAIILYVTRNDDDDDAMHVNLNSRMPLVIVGGT